MHPDKHNRLELIVYALLWAVLFMAPVLGSYVNASNQGDNSVEWDGILLLWKQFAVFFLLFLVHNFLLAPLLIERQRRWLYVTLIGVLVAAFAIVQCRQRPVEPKPLMEKRMGDMGRMDDMGDMDDTDRWKPDFKPAFKPHDRHRPSDIPPPALDEKPERTMERPPIVLGQHDIVAIIVLILMLGMNLGVKLYFRQLRDGQRLQMLEKRSLEQQLEYLRYQINPHFLMNTLNNIHALVDIDAERAKDSIVQLSKIMRFVLYEGAKQAVPLARELAFTQDYIQLMRMRVTDRVSITVNMPERVPDGLIPPLVLITFVENAFKHGVSYRQPSFISMNVETTTADDATTCLHFTCSNSKLPASDDQHGGVGLQNARQRLDLIYGNRYSLQIEDKPESYNIELILPLLKENGTSSQ